MKLSSISGVVVPVRDPEVSRDFYQQLGFRTGNSGAGFATVYVIWFWIEFVVGEPTPSTSAISVKVEDVETAAEELAELGLGGHLVGGYGLTGNGRKGIRVIDPDGYQVELFVK